MFEIVKNKNRPFRSNYLLLSSSTLALLGCGGGSTTNNKDTILGNSKKDTIPTSSSFGLTNDIFVDSMTHGVKWDFEDQQSYGYAIAGSSDGVKFGELEVIEDVFDDVMNSFHSYTGVNLQYSGEYENSLSAYNSGVEFVVTLDGSSNDQIFNDFGPLYNPDINASDIMAIAGPPIIGAEIGEIAGLREDFEGNVIINYDHSNVLAAYAASTTDGSTFKNLLLHEYGHVFGVKHPHDDGGTGRPEFGTYGGLSSAFDNDLYTVMSYEDTHGGDHDLAKYDPSTYMLLDVLTLQYLYGKNLNHNTGDTDHKIYNTDSFRSIWDPEGENTVDISNSKTDWYISLPWFVWSDLSNEPTGWAATYDNPSLDIPSDLVWLIGDFDNVNGGSGNDTIAGNSFDNHLSGGHGNDTIEGWEGNDTLIGGYGKDTFYFALGWGKDKITDFDPQNDKIVLLDEFLEPIDLNRVKIEVIDKETSFELSEKSILTVINFDYSADQSILNDEQLKSAEDTDRATEDATSDQTSTSTETETNDSMDSADVIEMGKAITGQLSSSSDFDVFKFDTAQASTLRLFFDVPTSSTYNLYFIASVFDAAGNFLSSKQVGVDTVFSTALNAAGTYYIQIEDSSFFDGGRYTITGSLTDGTAGLETEPNDSIKTADSITSGSVTKGQLWWKTDTDYYKISTNGASTISIDFNAPTNSSYNDYFKVSLLNASGTIMASQDTGKDFSFDTGVDSAGDYFVLVQDSTFYTDLDYEISASVNAADQTSTSTETETNDSTVSADVIEMGKAITGQLSSSSDFDYFKFDVAQASTFQLAFDAPTNSSYNDYFTTAVLDAAGNTLSSHQGGSDITFSTALNAAGTYYIQITDSTFHDSGQYSLTGSLTSGTSGIETETNDSIGTADVMTSGGSTKGQIRSKTDTDYYKISTNGASTISIDFDAPTNSSYNDYFKVSLLNASGTILASQDTGKDISFDTGVDSAGDYFVLVQDSTFLSTDEYSVSAIII